MYVYVPFFDQRIFLTLKNITIQVRWNLGLIPAWGHSKNERDAEVDQRL